MSHNEQANSLGFEKATMIAIDNLDGSSRANTAAFEELKGAINRGLQAHARRLEALELSKTERPSVEARTTALENRLVELEERDDDQEHDEDDPDGQRELLCEVADCLLDSRFIDFVKRGRPLSCAHRAQLFGLFALLEPFQDHALG